MISRRSNRLTLCAVLTLIALGGSGAVVRSVQAASFRGLAEGDPGALEQVVVYGMNAKGDQLVGSAQDPGAATSTWFVYDEATLGIQDGDPHLPPGYRGTARGQQTTIDGQIRRTVGGTAGLAERVFVRTQDAGTPSDTTTLLPAYPTGSSAMTGNGIGRNGNVIGDYSVGLVNRDFFYEAATGTYTAVSLHEYNAIDAAGDRHVGMLRSSPTDEAYLWERATSSRGLGFLPGGSESEAHGISASGRVVVGSSESNTTGAGVQEAFRWHPDFGMHSLEPIQGGAQRESVALATSDANVVAGWYRSGPGQTAAFLWTPAIGRVDLASHLTTHYGLVSELVGWTLEKATHLSADGTIIAGIGLDPLGNVDSWVVDLNGPDVVELRMRPIDPDASPSLWEFYLRCGDQPVSALDFGIIEPPTMPALDLFDFGGCNDYQGGSELFCTAAGAIGPTVAETSFVTLPSGQDTGAVRGDTLYVTLFGQPTNGGLLCSPGDAEAYLASFWIDQPTPELMVSALADRVGLDGQGNELPLGSIRLIRERESPATEVTIRPALDDVDGTRFMFSVDSDEPLAKFSFGIIVPPNAEEVSFGDCVVDLGGLGGRGCADGLELGSTIDYTSVRTIGPDSELASFGGRTDTLYVYFEGNLGGPDPSPGINVPGKRTQLGVFSFDTAHPGDFGWLPTVTFHAVEEIDTFWSDFQDWEDRDLNDLSGTVTFASYEYGGGEDPDTDADGIEDADDRCPFITSTNIDGGTLEQPGTVAATSPDGIGDECQCGDLIGPPHYVIPLDVDLLRDALNDPVVAGTIPAADLLKCNSIGPILDAIDSTTQLRRDCNANDIFALLRGRNGELPLVPTPGSFPSCPDVMTP
ncbi:MAG: hypothetical protein CL908_02405 [Deltaproteobacteria bacterium]|nr:hypothetical protein [Deltaproteobacteria bacterium]